MLLFMFAILLTGSYYFHRHYKDRGEEGKSNATSMLSLYVGAILVGFLLYSFVIYWNAIKEFPQTVEYTQFHDLITLLVLFAVVNALSLPYLTKRYNWQRYTLLLAAFAVLLLIILIGSQLSSTVLASTVLDYAGIDLDIFSQLWFSILQDPVVLIVAAIMTFGGIFKTINVVGSDILGDILVSWVPTIIWVMIVTNNIQVPVQIVALFQGMAWFGWLLYVLFTAIIFIMLIATINLFTGLATRVGGAF